MRSGSFAIEEGEGAPPCPACVSLPLLRILHFSAPSTQTHPTSTPHHSMSGIIDSVKSMAEAVAWPNKEEELGKGEHDAAVGVTASHDPPEGLWDELHGDAGLRTIKTHGNIGEGHGSGLQTKAVNHQEELAARTRLQREGLFEPHLKHDELVNLSDKHREVAEGSTTFTERSEEEARGEPAPSDNGGERLV